MSAKLSALRPVPRPAGPATVDGDRPDVLVEIRVLLRAPGDATTAARELVERLAALLDGAPRLDDRPAHPTTGTGGTDRRRLTGPEELVAVPVGALGREQLLREVWGYGPCLGARTVDVHVSRLRHKLAGRGPVIATVHGIGYRLDPAERLRIAAD
ncbi:response regulator transcription factor [Micromonospora avicenniae]|uniref:response regulator transcription factor n=1 Tax=Micromonospora avicenniae TaxID=1198245 RepID=UPI003420B577